MNVLVVDDEENYRHSLELSITAAGHEVHTARDGEDALSVGGQFPPDVLVVDWRLGSRLDGIDVAESLRRASPELKTILITGYANPELRVRAETRGVFALLEKPFELANLIGAVEQAEQVCARRIVRCVGCGIRLPLLRPLPREAEQIWACSFCGQRYSARLDSSCAPEVLANASPVETDS